MANNAFFDFGLKNGGIGEAVLNRDAGRTHKGSPDIHFRQRCLCEIPTKEAVARKRTANGDHVEAFVFCCFHKCGRLWVTIVIFCFADRCRIKQVVVEPESTKRFLLFSTIDAQESRSSPFLYDEAARAFPRGQGSRFDGGRTAVNFLTRPCFFSSLRSRRVVISEIANRFANSSNETVPF